MPDDTARQQYIVFRRTDNHCITWMVKAPSLHDAVTAWIVNECSDATMLENGHVLSENPPWKPIEYTHPLEFVESEEKSLDGQCGWMWEIQRLDEHKWEMPFTELFLSKDPFAVEGYINACLPLFRKSFPSVRRRHAFVWYLKSGALVTFHRVRRAASSAPIEILARFLLPWRNDKVVSWNGTYDDILEDMNIG